MTALLDMAMMVANSTGTGTITLGNIITGYQSFANAGAVNNQVFSYGIQDTGSTWEVGKGTYITNSTGNFIANSTGGSTRAPLWSSNNGGPINLSGTGQIYATFLDEDYETLKIANSLNIGANVIINTSSCFYGTATANSFGNSSVEIVANSTAQTVTSPISYLVQNSTANTLIGVAAITLSNVGGGISANLFTSNTVANSVAMTWVNSTANTVVTPGGVKLAGAGSNTGLTLGTAQLQTNAPSNGYSFITNGLMIQWGWVSVANTPTGVNFPQKFNSNCFSLVVSVESNTPIANGWARASIVNTSQFSVLTGNSTAVIVNWMAIGN